MKKFSLLRKKNLAFDDNQESSSLISEVSNWYADRYEHMLVQRNLLLLFVFLSFVIILVSVLVIRQVSLSKSVDPFVIEIEERSG
ncbi:MAG: VirB8/TrbF family protein, partial [Burkholderiales bacterium]